MAIYRFEAKIISRGQQRSTVAAAAYQSGSAVNGGKSAVKAAAYRAGEQLTDERTGERADYSNKRGVLGSEIMLPEGVASIFRDRQHLWNAVEAIEKRKDAQLARDFIISLPWEMTQAQRVALTREFVKAEFCDKGLIADIAWHAPDRDGSDKNYHAHVMTPLRRIEGDAFARRKDRPAGPDHPAKAWAAELLRLREAWADMANEHLAMAGLDIRIDHRSLAERGIDREPEPKIGPLGTQIMREGRESLAANDNREVKARNADRARLKADIAAAVAEEAQLVDLVTRRLRSGEMKPEPVNDETLRLQHEREAEALRELQQQDARIQQFKQAQEQQAEEAKKQREQSAKDEAARRQEGEIANAPARYSVALADNYDARDPYGSLARASMAEYKALVIGQEQLRIAIAKEQDSDKRRLLELRKQIEATDYMAITERRLAGISATIAGREDAPHAILNHARADAYQERAAELRQERAALMVAREQEAQRRQAQGAQPEPPKRGGATKEDAAKDESSAKRAAKQQTGVDAQPGKPAETGRTDTTSRSTGDKRREEENRAKVTGRKEGDAELSEAQQAKLDKLNQTKAAYAAYNAQKQKDRDRGGGGRGR